MSNAKALTECMYEENMLVRMFGTKEEPWFVAIDVLRALGMHTKNISRTLERLDSDEKGVVKLTTPGGQQDTWIISEPGFYRVALSARTEKAKKFQRWVTHDVLPRIRKYGYYKLTIAEEKANTLNSIMETLGVTALEKKYYKMTLPDLKRESKKLKNEKNAEEEIKRMKEKYPYTYGDIWSVVVYYKWLEQLIHYHGITENKKYCYKCADGTLLFSELLKERARRYATDPYYEWED